MLQSKATRFVTSNFLVAVTALVTTIAARGAKAADYTINDSFNIPTDWTPWVSSKVSAAVFVQNDTAAFNAPSDLAILFARGGSSSDFALADKIFEVPNSFLPGQRPGACLSETLVRPNIGAKMFYQILDPDTSVILGSNMATYARSTVWQAIGVYAPSCPRRIKLRIGVTGTSTDQSLFVDAMWVRFAF